ncbi:MAG: metallophosphoesterase [Oscillospiraceae bacterium]|jgi:hypothetical protein|nr:metallophosphoesterase [Oscillospiraceae bacterium]
MDFSGILAKLGAWLLSLHTALGGVFILPVSIQMVTDPAVFDVGGGSYAIVWVTSKRGTGWVTFSSGGTDYTVYEQSSGTIKSDDTIHVVKVPKAKLDNNSYSVHSQYTFLNFAYFSIKGKTVDSSTYNFRGYSGQDEIKALTFSDIHGLYADSFIVAKMLVDKPDLVLLPGDITLDWLLVKQTFVDEVLNTAAVLSESSCPVVYARGNHETRGAFATEVKKYFPTNTGELYFTTNYGPISMLVLDTGEDKVDTDPEYGGLANFEAYRAQQYEWMTNLQKDVSQDYQYRMTIAHIPTIDNHFGTDWIAPMKNNLDINFMVSGHTDPNAIWRNVTDFPIFVDGGRTGSEFRGSMITFKDGKYLCKSINKVGKVFVNEYA